MTMPLKQDILIETIEEVGEDWSVVSQAVGATEQECQQQFEYLKEEAKNNFSHEKKAVMGTGGGPPETSTDDYVMGKVKGLIGPAIDGIYTKYDGDRLLAGSEPFIEHHVGEEAVEKCAAEEQESRPFENKRGNLKRKKNVLLKQTKKSVGNITVSDKFKDLAVCKSELVRSQMAIQDIKYKDALAQYEHNEKVRVLELEELKEKIARYKKQFEKELARI